MRASACCCKTEEENNRMLDDIIDRHKKSKGNLIPVLHDIQELYGYIPADVQEKIAKKLNVSLSEIYGVITFYHHFSLKQKGKYKISVCMGTACYVKGAGPILDRFKEKLNLEIGETTSDGKFTLEACRCLGACGLAPALVVNDEVYGCLTKDDVEKIIEKYNNIIEE